MFALITRLFALLNGLDVYLNNTKEGKYSLQDGKDINIVIDGVWVHRDALSETWDAIYTLMALRGKLTHRYFTRSPLYAQYERMNTEVAAMRDRADGVLDDLYEQWTAVMVAQES